MRVRFDRLLRLFGTVLLLTAATRPAEAQSPAAQYVGRTVEGIHLALENRPTTEEALLDLIEIKVGEPLSIAAVRESIEHIYGLGRFQDVQVEGTAGASGGVSIRFNLIPFHNIQRIVFRGTLGLSEGQLRDTVVDRYGPSPSVGRVESAIRTLQQLYADQGYLHPKIEANTEVLHDPDRAYLTFSIDAGPRAVIGRVTIDGNPQATREELLRRLNAKPGDVFLRPRIQERLDDYVRRLKQKRFYGAEGSMQALDSPDGTSVDLTLVVDSGLPVSVRFEGDPVPAARLAELAPLEREGSIDEDLLEDSEGRIENFLRQQGYWKADVSVRREPSETALAIVFRVSRGSQYRLAGRPEIIGAQALTPIEVVARLPMDAGALFVESQLTAGINALRDLYHQRGFANVDIKSAVNEVDSPSPGEGLVRPVVAIVEGPRSLVGTVAIAGNSSISTPELRPLVPMLPGEPYFEPRVVDGRDALILEYLNRGFAEAVVNVTLNPSADRTQVDITFNVQEGPQSIVDHILIVGNVHTKPDVILRELQFSPGRPFGLADQFESRRRLSALGLFRRVQITELRHGTEHDVLVTVEEAPATTIGYGGGVEAYTKRRTTGTDTFDDQLEFAPRGFFDIGRRNLFGANRSVNLYTRVSLGPKDAPDDPAVDGTGIVISEYRVVATYRQPTWFGANDLTVNGVLEQGARTTFNFTRQGFNVDVVRRLSPALRVSGRYSLSSTRTFDERLSEEDQAAIDRLFPEVRLSGFSGAVAHDTRDDLLEPTRGAFLSAEGSLAARALGGEVGFMKSYVQGFSFYRLPGRRAIVFASRAALGLADGFEREVDTVDENGNPVTEVVEDLPASERFFAGGDTTIRGYSLDSVGAPNTISPNGYPTGGNAVLLLNGELRVPVWKDFGAVFFVDGGNVFRRVTEFDIGELRGSYGFGLRYKSPVGPIRVDLGFKLDRRLVAGELEPRTAIHFSLGQAF